MNQQSHCLKNFLWIALTITFLRIIYLFFNHRNLDLEEAQYWTWSQHLALGYHSKPPMISWVIYFSTWLFGNSEGAIRIISPLTYLGTSLFLYGCGKNLYHKTVGFWTGLTVLLLPGVTYSATIISTDPLLIFCWSAAFYFFIRGCQSAKLRFWIGCGIFIGLGLLSKYTMLVFLLSAIVYFISTLNKPSPLKKPGPYLALVIAILVFLPNAIWNTQHHNAAITHVINHNAHVEGIHWHIKNLLVFLITQMAILGPVIACFLVIAFFRAKKTVHLDHYRLLLSFTLPILIIICIEALLAKAYTNWAAVAYPSGTLLTVAYMWENKFQGWLKFSFWLNVLIAILLAGWELMVAYGYCSWPIPDHPNWQEFGSELQKQHNLYANTLYLTDSRELWSKSLYYGKVNRNNLYVWDPDHSVDWVDNPAHTTIPTGKNFIFMAHKPYLPINMAHSVQQYQFLKEVTISQRLLLRRTHVYFFWLKGLNTRVGVPAEGNSTLRDGGSQGGEP